MFNGFYSGKRVLVTGHTGFKGGWLSFWLHQLGAIVWGVSLPPPTHPNLHELIAKEVFAGETLCDITDLDGLRQALEEAQPEVIFHLAAQAIVRTSYAEPLETFRINALGTAHLLEAVRRHELPCPVIVVTSDKCYENREWEFSYRENDPLGGHDPYSMSKAAAELVAQAWSRSFFQPSPRLGPVATVRAGNVIGGGDYAVDRIVPDCVRALTEEQPIVVRRPSAIRPWQHVLECLSGYLWLAARLSAEGKRSPLQSAFNFGPEPSARQPVQRLVEEILAIWPGRWVDGSSPKAPHEASLLSLSIEKVGALLGWYPAWNFKEAVQHTVAWYHRRHVLKAADMLPFMREQVGDYVRAANARGLAWCRGKGKVEEGVGDARPR
ncbi:CDP-glucose 4,6-dehydratase [Verrucomicrobia bacterium]|nr:CDP-glucose 4,6-dehydratase [Verrucomicrobiota bacterium]